MSTNIYNAIQNLYNMDLKTWQEVLTEMYTKMEEINGKYEEVINQLKFITITSDSGEKFKIVVSSEGQLSTVKI